VIHHIFLNVGYLCCVCVSYLLHVTI